MGIDIGNDAVVYTLRDICIACVRRAGLCNRIEFQTVASVNLVVDTELESRIKEMVCVADISRSGFECAGSLGCFDALIGVMAVVQVFVAAVADSALFSHFGEVPSTTVEHVGRTLHGLVVKGNTVVQIDLVEGPFVLEPRFDVAHVDSVVVSEAASVGFDYLVVVACDLVLADVRNVLLRKAAVGSQLLDIAVRERIYVQPLITAQQVVQSLVVNTLRELALYAQRHLQMIIFGVDIVEGCVCLLDVVVAAFQDITSRSVRIIGIVGVVGRIDVLPVDLGRLVIARFPKVNEFVVLVLIDGRTNEVAVVSDKAGAETVTLQVLADEETPRIVFSVLVEELSCGRLAIRVRDLAIPHEGRQVAVVVRARIRCVVEIERRVGIHRVVVSRSHFQVLLLVDLVFIGSNDGRVIGLDDTRVAHFTVLVTPIRVVVIRAGQVIHLLGHGCVLAALGRSTEGDQLEAGIIPDALGCEEIPQRVVFDAFSNDTFVVHIRREAVSQLSGESPSVLQHAAGIGRVHAGFVVAVRSGYTYFPTLRIAACPHQVVGRLSESAESEVGCFDRVEHLFVSAGIVQTAHSGVVELAAFSGGEVQTLDVVALCR